MQSKNWIVRVKPSGELYQVVAVDAAEARRAMAGEVPDLANAELELFELESLARNHPEKLA